MIGRQKTRKGLRINEFTVFGAFIAVAVFGLGYGIIASSTGRFEAAPVMEGAPWQRIPSLTSAEYEAQASEVLSPFLGQALAMTQDDLAGDTTAASALVEKTEERLLRISHVPVDHKDFHLRAVLLLEQWKRALAGSGADRGVVLGKTKELVDGDPWLQP